MPERQGGRAHYNPKYKAMKQKENFPAKLCTPRVPRKPLAYKYVLARAYTFCGRGAYLGAEGAAAYFRAASRHSHGGARTGAVGSEGRATNSYP